MPVIKPEIIHFLETKEDSQVIKNVLGCKPRTGLIITTILEYGLSILYIYLALFYKVEAISEASREVPTEKKWLLGYSSFLKTMEIWVVFDRVTIILTTSIMMLGYVHLRRSLLLPYMTYVCISVIGNLISLLMFDFTNFLVLVCIVVMIFELSSALTCYGLWKMMHFRELVTMEYNRYCRLSLLKEELIDDEDALNDKRSHID